mmetsp:Transcript_25434/g.33001  ORF Transcript_25434/g.33001 Transcript_25434/m.33001 type:complete len:252 (-) Transcript_25434:200-955(-)
MAPSLTKNELQDALTNAPYSLMKKIPSLQDLQELDIWKPEKLAILHDDMNIGVLSVLSVMSIMCIWNLRTDWLATTLTYMTVGYIAFDTMWIAFQRESVKSPRTVLGHHIAVLVVLIDPVTTPVHRVYTAAAMIVEINTTLLIVRRRFKLGLLCEIPFAMSWILIRIIWYPFFTVYLLLCAFPEKLAPLYPQSFVQVRLELEQQQPETFALPSMAMWIGICIFQLWWSKPLVGSWFRQIRGKVVKPQSKYL